MQYTRYIALVFLPVSLMITLAWTSIDEPVAQLRLDYAALCAAEDDYRAQRELNGLDGTEASDYAAYVARLQRRVFEDCRVVIQSGSPYPNDLPCPVIVPPTTQSADIAVRAEQTPEEQIAAMDRALGAGLGEYDERLLREQERIKAASPNNNLDGGGDGSSGVGNGTEGGTEGDSESGAEIDDGVPGDERESEDSDDQSAGGPSDSSDGAGAPGTDSDLPADIPDGSDDDVVARQLREAAEKETDPELKAKLWEEYRRYKRGTT